jgi:hypothetical protein
VHGGELGAPRGREGVVPAHVAGADKEDVAGPGLGGLAGGDGVERGGGDLVRFKGVDGDVVGLGPGDVVEEDAAADDAASFDPG